MPFGEIHVVDERKRFIDDVHRSVRSFTAVCERYGISRNTGYTWLGRWRKHGPRGLADRSSRPKSCPWATAPEVVEAILEVRRKYEDFGPKKICWYLSKNTPALELPSRRPYTTSSCATIWFRELVGEFGDGIQVDRTRLQRSPTQRGRPTSRASSRWATGDYAIRLTVQDMHSRFVLECRGRPDVTIFWSDPSVYAAVPPLWAARAYPYGQRDPVRFECSGTPVSAVDVVRPTPNPAGADRAGLPTTERETREHAPRSEATNNPTSAFEHADSATGVSRVPESVQRHPTS